METKIIDHHPETPSSTTFIFEKPPGFVYAPGQFVNVELQVENCDNRCNKRNFSLPSSPLDDFLMITTRHGVSRFKQTFEAFTKGDRFRFTGPLGRFVLSEDSHIPAVFLSGGIGITPLHSMIKYATQKNLTKPITVIYSNSNENDIPYKTELDELDEKNAHLTIHHTITNPTEQWTGKKGRIDENIIHELVPNIQEVEFYVCGPAQMVLALKKVLVDMGISVERIKSELFTGY